MLWQAVTMLQPHMLAEEILPAKEMPRCKALIPLGGRANLRVAGRRYFVSRGQMLQQLEHLATHFGSVDCSVRCTRRLRQIFKRVLSPTNEWGCAA